MGHYIQGLIFSKELATESRRLIPSGRCAALAQGLCFLPIVDRVVDDLRVAHPDLGGSAKGFERLSAAVEWLAIELARRATVACIETEYHGGSGAQASIVWREGLVVLPLTTAEIGPINEALLILGVRRLGAHDEFDAVRLGKYRSNANWFQKAPAV